MSKSSMKKMTAGVGLALIGTTSVAGAANAITTDEAKPLKYEALYLLRLTVRPRRTSLLIILHLMRL